MSWRTIVVEKQSKISSESDLLIVHNDEGVHSIPLEDVGTLLVSSTRSVITTYAINAMLKKDIRILCCDEKGFPSGQFMPKRSSIGRRKKVLTQMSWDQDRKDILWQQIVRQKIAVQAHTLDYLEMKDSDKLKDLIPHVKPGDTDNREAVAAHLYFPRLFSYEFTRSDEDQNINSLLNYGYAIVLSEVSRCIALHGYLDEFGIHHDNDHNPHNLACDFMEPFRPFVDERVAQIGDTPLDPEHKRNLVRLLREDSERLHTTVANAIEKFVTAALRYMADGKKLPEMDLHE